MRGADLRAAGELRSLGRPAAGGDGGDDAERVRPAVPGDRRGALRAGLPRLDGVVRPAGDADAGAGPLPGGGERAPGAGRADGGALGPDGGVLPLGGPRFDRPVPGRGYAWWYLDALSDDGRHGLTVIAFVGSVFSPYYALARRRGAGDPHDHCAAD